MGPPPVTTDEDDGNGDGDGDGDGDEDGGDGDGDGDDDGDDDDDDDGLFIKWSFRGTVAPCFPRFNDTPGEPGHSRYND